MEPVLEQLINQLPSQPERLSENYVRKIHRRFPVPIEHEILWSDIFSFRGYPSGIVITDKALIVKATKKEVKHTKHHIKTNNKKKERDKRSKIPKEIYRIIPWEYFDPSDYSIEINQENKEEDKYVFKAGDTELVSFSNKALYELFESYKTIEQETEDKIENVIKNSTIAAMNANNVEGTLFNATYGADQSRTGHGIYAEEAGAKLDRIHREKSTVVGRDNAKNGPDKIVNAVAVQCKYCKTASASVNACFESNKAGIKTFRYYDLNGKPMKIEVPADQYANAIDLMKTRIAEGKVPGVTNPDDAYDIIRRGKITYNQARNLAKAGTIESLAYDASTCAVNCFSALGVSSIVAFAQAYWNTKDFKAAAKCALVTGLQVYCLSFTGGIVASQLSRTGAANVLKPIARNVVDSLSPQTTQNIVNAFRTFAGKKPIYGAAAQKSFVRFLGSNTLTEGAFFVVFTIPDLYRICTGKITGAQYVKNMLSLAASFAGAIVATAAAGGLIGKEFGEALDKKAVAAMGQVVGIIGGGVVGGGVKAVGNIVHEDEAFVTTRMFNAVMITMLIEYMFSDSEFDKLIELLNNDKKGIKKLQIGLLKEDKQEESIRQYLQPKITEIIRERTSIPKERESLIYDSMNNMMLSGELINEM